MSAVQDMVRTLVEDMHQKESAEVEERLALAMFRGKNLAVGRKTEFHHEATGSHVRVTLVFAEMVPGDANSPFPKGTTDMDRWTLHLCGGMRVGVA